MNMPSRVPDQEAKPAPGPLLLVQSFVNTWDADHGSDLLLDRSTASEWLTAAGLWAGDRAPGYDFLDLARRVREAIRAMLVANGGGPQPGPNALQPLHAVTVAARPSLHVGQDGHLAIGTEPAGKPEAALLTLLLVIRDAQSDGTWQRLKACGNPDCQWAFYDRSHGQAGAWCDMATCGNRMKNRKFRRRT